jgi:hypothetical protein
MEWDRTHETAEKIEWERADGYAYVVARATADGEWAVSLDRLEQASEGETYRHETAPDRETAVSVATGWLDGEEADGSHESSP